MEKNSLIILWTDYDGLHLDFSPHWAFTSYTDNRNYYSRINRLYEVFHFAIINLLYLRKSLDAWPMAWNLWLCQVLTCWAWTSIPRSSLFQWILDYLDQTCRRQMKEIRFLCHSSGSLDPGCRSHSSHPMDCREYLHRGVTNSLSKMKGPLKTYYTVESTILYQINFSIWI